MIIPDYILNIINKIEESGYEAYIVGGCVRDYFLDKTPNDWDITTSALPEDILRIFAQLPTIPTGIRHGTVTVIADKMPVEITTYRIDGEYTDNETVQMLGMQDTTYMVFFDDGTVYVCMEEEEFICTYDDTCIYDEDGYATEYAIVDGLLELYMEDNMTFYFEEF